MIFLQNIQQFRTHSGNYKFFKLSTKNEIYKIAQEYAAGLKISQAANSTSEVDDDDIVELDNTGPM